MLKLFIACLLLTCCSIFSFAQSAPVAQTPAAASAPVVAENDLTPEEMRTIRPLVDDYNKKQAALVSAQADRDAADMKLAAYFWRMLAKRKLDPDQWLPKDDWSGIYPKPQPNAPNSTPPATESKPKANETKPK